MFYMPGSGLEAHLQTCEGLATPELDGGLGTLHHFLSGQEWIHFETNSLKKLKYFPWNFGVVESNYILLIYDYSNL